ncbi:MAG: hypothetical protein ACRC33_18285, partial [Gemmataceae bacterium]
ASAPRRRVRLQPGPHARDLSGVRQRAAHHLDGRAVRLDPPDEGRAEVVRQVAECVSGVAVIQGVDEVVQEPLERQPAAVLHPDDLERGHVASPLIFSTRASAMAHARS